MKILCFVFYGFASDIVYEEGTEKENNTQRVEVAGYMQTVWV